MALPAQGVPSATEPAVKGPLRHAQFLKAARAGHIDLLFLGDSITDFWRRPDRGLPVWRKYFAPLSAANFGISGDRTQHVLWRIQHGELEGFRAKCIVLLLGTDNLSGPGNVRNTKEETIAGLRLVVDEIRARQPQARLLVLGLLPRGVPANGPYRRSVTAVNAALATWDDGRNIFFLDIGDRFLQPDGRLSTDLMVDGLHPNTQGYEVWASAIIGKVTQLMAMR